MSDQVDAKEIEALVGAKRDFSQHIGRWVTREDKVYILHSTECFDARNDLRECPFSRALDNGCQIEHWKSYEDRPVVLAILSKRLVPRQTWQDPTCGQQHPSSLVHKALYESVHDAYERSRIKEAVLRERLQKANELLEAHGWYTFGTHAGDEPAREGIIFSKQTDEAGMPLWERLPGE